MTTYPSLQSCRQRREARRGGRRRPPRPDGVAPLYGAGSDNYWTNAPLGDPQATCGVRMSTALSTVDTNVFANPAL